jgi:hypothetical protein
LIGGGLMELKIDGPIDPEDIQMLEELFQLVVRNLARRMDSAQVTGEI